MAVLKTLKAFPPRIKNPQSFPLSMIFRIKKTHKNFYKMFIDFSQLCLQIL